MPEKPRNVGASVRQRLLNLARASEQPLELLLTRYALERSANPLHLRRSALAGGRFCQMQYRIESLPTLSRVINLT